MSSPSPAARHTLFERFDHLALAVADARAILPLLELLGGTYRTGGHHPTAGFRWIQYDLPAGPKIEILSPLDAGDDEHFLNRFLRERGEGPHHVTFKVSDIAAAVSAMRALGYEVVGENLAPASWKEAFVHPRSSHGLLIQLAQWEDGGDDPGRPLDEVLGPEVP